MLFNSYAFILIFLPIAFAGYLAFSRGPSLLSAAWLVLCSLAFYGIWNPAFLLLLVGSVCFNYLSGGIISNSEESRKQIAFVFAVTVNLSLLVFFKYLQPFVEFTAQYGLLKDPIWLHIILPLGISFFTFTQIGYLVDRRDGLGGDLDPLRYMLFVTFFPHLIAGPILHVREVGSQLLDPETFKPKLAKIAPGLSLFVLGLTKKVLIADPLAGTVALGFGRAGQLGAADGWFTAVAYTMQLYFDFSGYSDMAIGLAAIFGVRFPVNFNSPYKSRGIIEYWQRWHMTLSRYLQLLLYGPIALAISRRRVAKGLKVSRKAMQSPSAFASLVITPTMITMGLAGVWHGAGLQFLVFGLLHGAYLCVNHAARIFGKGVLAVRNEAAPVVERVWKIGLTYVAVLVAAVFFRAASCREALQLLTAMVGVHGPGLAPKLVSAMHINGALGSVLSQRTVTNIMTYPMMARLLVCLFIVWAAPNTQQILGRFSPTLESFVPPRWSLLQWRPHFVWAICIGLLLWADLMSLNQSTTFLYFQF